MDPISITTGALTLIGACVNVSISLRRLKNGAGESKTRITGLLSDVDSLRNVLESMEATLYDLQTHNSFQSTGHMGTHWLNLSRSLQDGQDALKDLEKLLNPPLNKDVSVLDDSRRYMRLKDAAEKLAEYRQHVQSYRDTIQFSIQTITL